MKIIKNICLLLGTLIFCLIISEVILRFFYPAYNIEKLPLGLHINDPIYGSRLTNNFSGRHIQEEFDVLISTNSIGLRDNEIVKKNASDIRILCLGDSFTFGFGVDLKDTYVKQLQVYLGDKLDLKNKNISLTAINAGTVGWGTIDETRYLKRDGIILQPDIVILLFFVGNDLWDNLNSFKQENKTLNNVQPIDSSQLSVSLQKNLRLYDYLFKLIKSNSRLSSILYSFGIRRIQSQIYMENDTIEYKQAMDLTKKSILEINEFLLSKKVPFVFVVLPEDMQIFYPQVIKSKGLVLDKVQRSLNQLCHDNNIACIDLLPILQNKPDLKKYYFKKDSHLNQEGQHFLATIIGDYLIENKTIKLK